jgi:hypothetical protein
MITTGKIVAINAAVYQVRLPIFESAGINKQCIVNCTLCYNPGNLNAYIINDLVYVGFVNNELSKPVILGKIYEGLENKATNFSYSSSLEVTEKAILPSDTTIGTISTKDIIALINNQNTTNSSSSVTNELIEIYNKDVVLSPSVWTVSTDTANNAMMVYSDSDDFPLVVTTDGLSFIAVDTTDTSGVFSFGTDLQAQWGLMAQIKQNGSIFFYCKFNSSTEDFDNQSITIHIHVMRKVQ